MEPIALFLKLGNISPLRHQVNPACQVPPDLLERLFGGDRFGAQRVHRGDVDLKNGTDEKEHQHKETNPNGKPFHSDGPGDLIQDPMEPVIVRFEGRRHHGDHPGENPMDEGKGHGRPQSREEADLGQNAEPAQQQKQKSADRRHDRKDLPRLNLTGRFPPRNLARPVEKQKIGDPQIHREGHDRPAEADGED